MTPGTLDRLTVLADVLGSVELEPPARPDPIEPEGFFWRHDGLTLATLYFPNNPSGITVSARGSDDFVLVRSVGGPLTVDHPSGHVTLSSGEVTVIIPENGLRLILAEGGRLDLARVRPGQSTTWAADLDDLLFHPFPETSLAMQLIANYAGYLLRHPVQSAGTADLLVAHFRALLPVLLQEIREHTGELVADDRMAAITAEIEVSLGDSDFTIADLAASQNVTTRTIQKCLHRNGTTFSRYLLERRLIWAREQLMTGSIAMPISQIAYGAGFNDLSYFNRSFRKRFGRTPSALRSARSGALVAVG